MERALLGTVVAGATGTLRSDSESEPPRPSTRSRPRASAASQAALTGKEARKHPKSPIVTVTHILYSSAHVRV